MVTPVGPACDKCPGATGDPWVAAQVSVRGLRGGVLDPVFARDNDAAITTAKLPATLRQFRAPGSLAQHADPPRILFPPNGVTLDHWGTIGPGPIRDRSPCASHAG